MVMSRTVTVTELVTAGCAFGTALATSINASPVVSAYDACALLSGRRNVRHAPVIMALA